MNAKHSLSLLALCLVTACGPADLDPSEVNTILFSSDGEIGGYHFGDSWDDIKAKHADVFEVRDEAGFEQLRRKVSDNAGSDGYFIGFNLDGAGKVESFEVSINGTKQNAVMVRKLFDDVIAHYDKTIGGGACFQAQGGPGNSSNCDWTSVPGKPQVSAMYIEGSDPIYGSIDISIAPPQPEG